MLNITTFFQEKQVKSMAFPFFPFSFSSILKT